MYIHIRIRIYLYICVYITDSRSLSFFLADRPPNLYTLGMDGSRPTARILIMYALYILFRGTVMSTGAFAFVFTRSFAGCFVLGFC